MTENIDDTVQKLVREKFNGEEPQWQEGSWGESVRIVVQIAQDDDNFYYRQGKRVFVQRKEGGPADFIPFCYGCETEVKVLRTHSPTVTGRRPGEVIAEGGTHYSFYCPKCDENKYNGEILDISV